MSEIQVGYTDPDDIAAWKTLLVPARQLSASLWELGNGPMLRLLKSPRKEVKGIVFKVHSLEAARDYLKANNLQGQTSQEQVQIKSPDDWEFNISLEE